MKKIGIFYGSSTGNTEIAAQQIQKAFGNSDAELFDVAKVGAQDLENFSNIILGASTWGAGDLQDDFDSFLSKIKNVDMQAKTVALFGCGDQETYSETFVDGMGEIWEMLEQKGCKIIGETSTDGYSHDSSRAEVDGKFVGLALDFDNQSDLTDERIEKWVSELKAAFE